MNINVKLLLAVVAAMAFGPFQLWGQSDIKIPDYASKTLYISGPAASLVVEGHDKNNMLMNLSPSDAQPMEVQEDRVVIQLRNEEKAVRLRIPAAMKVVCELEGIQYTGGSLGPGQSDYRSVTFKDLRGAIQFEGDGYHVSVENHSGSVDVTTYGNVDASIADLPKGAGISIDTYLGAVRVEVDDELDAQLKLTAKKGKATLD
ncbi:MAG: hypothetical protein AAFO94_16955, partial [Bacteroidota bacterium]